MILRIIIILACVLVFVNGCNSLISGVAGTHKLRSFSMEEVYDEGLGDADFVEISDAWTSGDYLYQPHRRASWPGFVHWPVLSKAQLDSLEKDQQVTVSLIAWTRRYEEGCTDRGDCIEKGAVRLKGLVRPFNNRFNRLSSLSSQQFELAEELSYIEYNRQPLAWYWNLALMVGAAIIIWLQEQWVARRKNNKKAQ